MPEPFQGGWARNFIPVGCAIGEDNKKEDPDCENPLRRALYGAQKFTITGTTIQATIALPRSQACIGQISATDSSALPASVSLEFTSCDDTLPQGGRLPIRVDGDTLYVDGQAFVRAGATVPPPGSAPLPRAPSAPVR